MKFIRTNKIRFEDKERFTERDINDRSIHLCSRWVNYLGEILINASEIKYAEALHYDKVHILINDLPKDHPLSTLIGDNTMQTVLVQPLDACKVLLKDSKNPFIIDMSITALNDMLQDKER